MIRLDSSIGQFCSKTEDYNLRLKDNVLTAKRKIFLVSRLMRWLLPSYNFCYILNELGQKFTEEMQGVKKSRIIEKIANKKENYLNKKRFIRISEGRRNRVSTLFQQVKNLGKIQSLFEDKDFCKILDRYEIQIDTAKTAGDVLKDFEEKVRRWAGLISIVPFDDSIGFGIRSLVIDKIKPFFEKLYQQDFIRVFSSVVERSDSETDEQCVKRIERVLASETPPSIESISLKGVQIAHLPKEIGRLSSLKELDFSRNWKLGGLPEQLWGLTGLKRLNLKFTDLTTLPGEIGQLSFLGELDLSGNQNLEALPKQLFDLKNLKWLNLSGINLTTLPGEIGRLTFLEGLDLSCNRELEALPEQLWGLTSLKRLNLKFTNLTTLSGKIGQLTSLEELDLFFNRNLKAFPEQACDLASLKGLGLGNINLITLPEKIGQLTSLEKLDLSCNQNLGALPKQLWNLENLKWLILRNTGVRLESVPKGIRERETLEISF